MLSGGDAHLYTGRAHDGPSSALLAWLAGDLAHQGFYGGVPRSGHRMSGRSQRELLKLLPERSAEKALWVLENKRVSLYVFEPSGRELWTVEGENQEYIVFQDFYCSCHDFYLESLAKTPKHHCYHIVAKLIAEQEGLYRKYTLPDLEFDQLMAELLGFIRRRDKLSA